MQGPRVEGPTSAGRPEETSAEVLGRVDEMIISLSQQLRLRLNLRLSDQQNLSSEDVDLQLLAWIWFHFQVQGDAPDQKLISYKNKNIFVYVIFFSPNAHHADFVPDGASQLPPGLTGSSSRLLPFCR